VNGEIKKIYHHQASALEASHKISHISDDVLEAKFEKFYLRQQNDMREMFQ